jgi:alpha-galactosidase
MATASNSAAKPAKAAAKAAKAEGHASHTQDAAVIGLPGTMPRPIKVAMLGAGSGFTPRLANDIMQTPNHCGGEIALVDIDEKRLKPMFAIVSQVAERFSQGKAKWKVTAQTDRKKALKGADYLINSIEVSGLGCVRHDNDIPAKYGVDQCIGDTIGPGGLFKGLRTVPVFLDILKDAEKLCPNVIVLNYTNPMSIMCLAAGRTSSLPIVGLCHSVQGSSAQLAKRAGVPLNEVDWECAGVNHLAWFTKFEHQGKSLYPKLFALAEKDLAGRPANPDDANDLVRKDMMLHFGAYITESSGHLSEYLPYYRKRKDLMERYCRPKYDGESSFYANNWPSWRKAADEKRAKMVSGEESTEWKRSFEYAAFIIEAREKNSAFTFHGNVMNRWKGGGPLIDNLPHDGVVEVKTLVDRNGLQPQAVGRLPRNMAAICAQNMAMYDLAAEAVIHRSKELAIQALTLDPLTAACCSPAEIKRMTLELFDAEKKFLPDYK